MKSKHDGNLLSSAPQERACWKSQESYPDGVWGRCHLGTFAITLWGGGAQISCCLMGSTDDGNETHLQSPELLPSVFPSVLSIFLKRTETKNRGLGVGEVESSNSVLKCHVE